MSRRGHAPRILRISGWFAGRRGMPRPGTPTATLRRLAMRFDAQADAAYHEHRSRTAGNRELLAGIEAEGAELSRAEQRLAEAHRRLAWILAEAVEPSWRAGELELPVELVERRRQREHLRRVRDARKRVEDERTAVAAFRTTAARARARIEADLQQTAADVRLLHADACALGACYLAAAERTHPEPAALAAAGALMLPRLPAWLLDVPDPAQHDDSTRHGEHHETRRREPALHVEPAVHADQALRRGPAPAATAPAATAPAATTPAVTTTAAATTAGTLTPVAATTAGTPAPVARLEVAL
jgi:hypothetical protein